MSHKTNLAQGHTRRPELRFPLRPSAQRDRDASGLDRLAPGVYSRHTLLYGVEVKFLLNRITVSREMETEMPNSRGGDAPDHEGTTSGLASGILAPGPS